jgi:hypothetical protein
VNAQSKFPKGDNDRGKNYQVTYARQSLELATSAMVVGRLCLAMM